MTEEFNSQIEGVRNELCQSRSAFAEERETMRKDSAEKQAKCEALSSELRASREESLEIRSRLMALRAQQGLMGEADDFSTKESFDRLEKELGAFIRFYDKQWGKTKKKIRKDLLNLKNLKGQDGEEDPS